MIQYRCDLCGKKLRYNEEFFIVRSEKKQGKLLIHSRCASENNIPLEEQKESLHI